MSAYHASRSLLFFVVFCVGALILLVSCAHHSAKGTSLNVVVDEMYSAMAAGDYSHFENKVGMNKAKGEKNPFVVYIIKVMSYKVINIEYIDKSNAKVHMQLVYNIENVENKSFDAIDTWQNNDGSWKIVDFNAPLDDSQTGSHYRVKPYVFNPDDFK